MMLVALCGATLTTSSTCAGLASLAVRGFGGSCLYQFAEGARNKRLSAFIKRQNLLLDTVQSFGAGLESFGAGIRDACEKSMSSKQKKFFGDLVKNIKKEVQTSFSTVKNEWKRRQQARKQKNKKERVAKSSKASKE